MREHAPARALEGGLIELGGSAKNAILPRPVSVGVLVVGALLLVAFVFWDRRAAHPLVPARLFREGNFAAGNVATLFVYAGLGLASLVPALTPVLAVRRCPDHVWPDRPHVRAGAAVPGVPS